MNKYKHVNLTDNILSGLTVGYIQFYNFTKSAEVFEKRMIEYLLTVSVATKLYDQISFDSKMQINIEYPLRQFYNNAFPEIKFVKKKGSFGGSRLIRRKFNPEPSKQRIDIAVTKAGQGFSRRSIYGIELKAINTSYTSIINDLRRLSEGMISNDKIDSNSITKCYSGFIKFYKNSFKPSKIRDLKNFRSNIISKVQNLLSQNFIKNKKYKQLDYRISTAIIDTQSAEEYKAIYSNQTDFIPEYRDATNETGEILAVVIQIKRK